ncbi:MAG: Brp/Blh family beta-carotene 15,15'-dioxygenase [Janthinobacterium lividum]
MLQRIAALVAIILLGVPHGALDGEIARSLLRPQFRRSWFAVFSVPYLMLAALVLLAWHFVPVVTLAAFLAASVWHFGSEETESKDPLDIVAVGGMPIAVAVLTHPAATALIFATVSQTAMFRPPIWLWAGSMLWLLPAAIWTIRRLQAGQHRQLLPPAVLAPCFLLLPPLTAFAIYFVCVHAPAHTAFLIQDKVGVPRVKDGWSAIRLALPVTGLTLLLGAVLWPLYPGTPDLRLLSLTIQGLAALTLPHMLFELWRNQDI